MRRISEFIDSWLFGFKCLCITGFALVVALFGGGLLSAPFLLAAELLGYNVDENRWITVAMFVVAPCLFGVALPASLKALMEQGTE